MFIAHGCFLFKTVVPDDNPYCEWTIWQKLNTKKNSENPIEIGNIK